MRSFLPFLAVLALAFAAGMGATELHAAGGDRQVSIRFPAFSLSPGERVSGITVTTSSGRLSAGCRPSRWTCEQNAATIHCFSLHPTYAIALTGMLPEILVTDLSGSRSLLAVKATVEYVDGDGREYSREFRESELLIK